MVKENVTSSGEVESDDEDSSVTRPPELLRRIFVHANLELYKELKQNKFPKELYEVHMFALRKKDEKTGIFRNILIIQFTYDAMHLST